MIINTMKNNLLMLFLFSSLFAFADDHEGDAKIESDFEMGCTNELDDDMDGLVDELDTDCQDEEEDKLIATVEGFDLSAYAVWGLGLAIISSVGSDSGTGTATTD